MEGQTAAVWPRRLSLGMGLQWHFYEHQLLTPLNTVQLPAIHALYFTDNRGCTNRGETCEFFWQKTDEREGKVGRVGEPYFYYDYWKIALILKKKE